MGTHESVTAEAGPTDWVAGLHQNGHPIKDYRGVWSTACELTKVVGRTPHDLRQPP